jgi:hypothetical protein
MVLGVAAARGEGWAVNARDFRRIALGMSEAVEGAHMGHPDFRVRNRIFATLHGDMLSGMVSLTPEQQQRVIEEHPQMFAPEAGAWGRQGCTRVTLAAADEETVGEAMTLAWRNVMERLSKPASQRRTPRTKKQR